MENNIKNKQKLFALYLWQPVFKPENWNNRTEVLDLYNLGRIDFRIDNPSCIELRPLSSITDDEAIEVAKIGLPDKVLYDYLWIPGTGKAIANSIDKGRQTNTFYPHFRFIDTADYLRSKGFALPYMGLSVETMVEYGWIKLTPLAPNL